MGLCGSSSQGVDESNGLKVDGWIMGRKIGKGATGKVYLAKNQKTGKLAAIKVCPLNQLKQVKRDGKLVHSEVYVWKDLIHRNIVRLYDSTQIGDQYLIMVTEYMKGGELFDRIVNQQGNYTERWARGIARDILRAIKYLHDKNVVHRDIKPENLLIDHSGHDFTVKLADFGFATYVGKKEEKKLKEHLGTPGYCAPEIYTSTNYGVECDMWSFGCILYILLCGYPPFDHDDDDAAAQQTVEGIYEFDGEEWEDKKLAITLIRGLLETDQYKRLNASEALKHKWMRIDKKSLSAKHMGGSVQNLRKYLAKRRWKRAQSAVRASLRLSRKSRRKSKNSSIKEPEKSLEGLKSEVGVALGGVELNGLE